MAATIKKWKCSPFTVTLQKDGENYQATATRKGKQQITFEAKQIVCGINGDSSIEETVQKIDCVASYVFTKDDPSKVWLFEGTAKNFREIVAGKKTLNEASSSAELDKAIGRFKTALKIAKKVPESVTEELENTINELTRRSFYLGMKESAVYLLPEKVREKFFEIIEDYEEDEELVDSLTEVADCSDDAPEIMLLKALLSEEKEDSGRAFNHYLRLAKEGGERFPCLEKSLSIIHRNKDDNRVQEIERQFEVLLSQIASDETELKPSCFICFNVDEKDIGQWLETHLVNDMQKSGIEPIFCLWHLRIGGRILDFQEGAFEADKVVIVCTPELYKKSKDNTKGTAQEIGLSKVRLLHAEKKDSIHTIFLKGKRKDSMPTAYFEDILGTKFATNTEMEKDSNLNYYFNVFQLLCSLKGIERQKARTIQTELLNQVESILSKG